MQLGTFCLLLPVRFLQVLPYGKTSEVHTKHDCHNFLRRLSLTKIYLGGNQITRVWASGNGRSLTVVETIHSVKNVRHDIVPGHSVRGVTALGGNYVFLARLVLSPPCISSARDGSSSAVSASDIMEDAKSSRFENHCRTPPKRSIRLRRTSTMPTWSGAAKESWHDTLVFGLQNYSEYLLLLLSEPIFSFFFAVSGHFDFNY